MTDDNEEMMKPKSYIKGGLLPDPNDGTEVQAPESAGGMRPRRHFQAEAGIGDAGEPGRVDPAVAARTPERSPAPSRVFGDTVVAGGMGVTRFGGYTRIKDQRTGKDTWVGPDGEVGDVPKSVRMMELMNGYVTSRSLQRDGKTWEQAIADVQNANSDNEAKRLANQAQFMQMKRDERVKRNAEMHKEAYGVAKIAYDRLLAGDGKEEVGSDGTHYRIVKIGGDDLQQVNDARLNMGAKDKIGAVMARIPISPDSKNPLDGPSFLFQVIENGNVKDGGAQKMIPFTLSGVRERYAKSLTNSGGNAKDADAAFGEWKDRVAANANKDWKAANPGDKDVVIAQGRNEIEQKKLDTAIVLADKEAKSKYDSIMAQADAKLKELQMQIASAEKEGNANRAAQLAVARMEAGIKGAVGYLNSLVQSGAAVSQEVVANIFKSFGVSFGGGDKRVHAVGETVKTNDGKPPKNPNMLVEKAKEQAAAPANAKAAKDAEKANARQAQANDKGQKQAEAANKPTEAAATKNDEQKPRPTSEELRRRNGERMRKREEEKEEEIDDAPFFDFNASDPFHGAKKKFVRALKRLDEDERKRAIRWAINYKRGLDRDPSNGKAKKAEMIIRSNHIKKEAWENPDSNVEDYIQ